MRTWPFVLGLLSVSVPLACSSFASKDDTTTTPTEDAGAPGAEASVPPPPGTDAGAEAGAPPVLWLKLDETDGTTAKNDGTGGSAGEVKGNINWRTGHIGGAFEFDGNTYLQVPIGARDVLKGTAFTIALWVNAKPHSGVDDSLFMYSDAFEVKLNGENQYPQLAINGGNYKSSLGLPSDQWHHLAFTFADTAVAFYMDGTAVDLSSGSNTTDAGTIRSPNTTTTTVGTRWNLDQYFLGLLDDVRVYDRALSSDEIASLAKN